MLTQGIPAGGLNTVGQIHVTNLLQFHAKRNGSDIAADLLSTHIAGAPVVDDQRRYLGFINEFDVIRALDAGKDLSNLVAEDIMRKDRLTVTISTSIMDAAAKMEEYHVLNLPVIDQNGVVVHSISRHDILRARIGFGVGFGIDP